MSYIKEENPWEYLTISVAFLSRTLSQNGSIAGRDLNEDYANLHCEYRVVTNPIRAAEKSMEVRTFY